MLRRTARRLAPSTTSGGGGVGLSTSAAVSANAATDATPTRASAGALLPWTARPFEVTHKVHTTQWKFLDQVFAHLGTVSPAELNDRAEAQGVRDVLRDLEDPVKALRRQQSRQSPRSSEKAGSIVKTEPLPPVAMVAATATPSTTPERRRRGRRPSDAEPVDATRLRGGIFSAFSNLWNVAAAGFNSANPPKVVGTQCGSTAAVKAADAVAMNAVAEVTSKASRAAAVAAAAAKTKSSGSGRGKSTTTATTPAHAKSMIAKAAATAATTTPKNSGVKAAAQASSRAASKAKKSSKKTKKDKSVVGTVHYV